jgi:hypothetical protein
MIPLARAKLYLQYYVIGFPANSRHAYKFDTDADA